jgi:signal transduction histidine kinase
MQDHLLPFPSSDESVAARSDLETVLNAWHGATLRLEKTHETLASEVARLTNELEVKNRELARKNRLADLGQMASHVAHEVRNNLVPVTLYLSLLKRRISDDRGSLDVLEKVEAGFTALDATVNDLLHFTSDHDPHRHRFDLAELIHEVCDSLNPQFRAQGIVESIDVSQGMSAEADRGMLRRALLNLVLNALDAMPDGGDLVITACRDGETLEIEVADSGPGLDEETSRRAFEPFYTTKGTGTGLGLSIVERVTSAHGGEVCAANCSEGGAAFTICLPRQARPVRIAA